jgi:hypothetical protein
MSVSGIGGLGFPRPNPKPDPGQVQRFKAMLSRLDTDGYFSYLATSVQQEEHDQREAIAPGRTTPIPDWYGPAEVMKMLVQKYGTEPQKAAWQSAPPPKGPASAQRVASLVKAGGPDMAKDIANVAIEAAGALLVGYKEFERPPVADLEDNPDPISLANFRSFLDEVERNRNTGDVQDALAAEEQRLATEWMNAHPRNPGDPIGMSGAVSPRQAMQALVARFGTPDEINAWGLGSENPE